MQIGVNSRVIVWYKLHSFTTTGAFSGYTISIAQQQATLTNVPEPRVLEVTNILHCINRWIIAGISLCKLPVAVPVLGLERVPHGKNHEYFCSTGRHARDDTGVVCWGFRVDEQEWADNVSHGDAQKDGRRNERLLGCSSDIL